MWLFWRSAYCHRAWKYHPPLAAEDDDAIETILNERFFHKPEMFYSPDKLVKSYGVPAPTPAFAYNALGRKPLPTKDQLIGDLVDSVAARFNLRYNDAKWLATTLNLIADDATALQRFLDGDLISEDKRND